jgi:hypothetical protein
VGRSARHDIDPTSVTLLGTPNPTGTHATFLVRGAGCPVPPGTKDGNGHKVKSPSQRVRHPAVQYTAHTVDVGFKVEDPGRWRCTGDDPGVRYTVYFPIALAGRQLRDSDRRPPQPFPVAPE